MFLEQVFAQVRSLANELKIPDIAIQKKQKQKQTNLVLNKQIVKSLPLDEHCMDDYVSTGEKSFNPN